jgi:hypothetical protein
MNQTSRDGDPGPLPGGKKVSEGLILAYFAIQLADILVMIVAFRNGYFQFGAGPIGSVMGLNELGVWVIMKTSAFFLLPVAIFTGRRRVILFLNFWFAWLLAWMILVLVILR